MFPCAALDGSEDFGESDRLLVTVASSSWGLNGFCRLETAPSFVACTENQSQAGLTVIDSLDGMRGTLKQ